MSEITEKCDCGKDAIWIYMPYNPNITNPYYCDDCVPRGCTCNKEPKDGNWDNLDESNWIQPKDEKGREYPCVEFEHLI